MINENILETEKVYKTSIVIKSKGALALSDIIKGLKNWRVWLFLSWHDIKLNYRRSALGPLWITLSLSVTIFSIGLLYGKLFKMDLKLYYPFLATGMISWGLISSLILDGMNIFVDSESLIKQIKHPYFMFVFRVISRVFITFFHNIVLLIPISVFFHLKFTTAILFLPFSLVLLWLNAVSYGTILSMISARFRDFKPIVTNLMQVIFFLTPVMWSPDAIPKQYAYIINVNPFAQFLFLIRAPLLGNMPSFYSLEIVLAITVVGLISSFLFFSYYRTRIAYWL